jgi:hypothetical protein
MRNVLSALVVSAVMVLASSAFAVELTTKATATTTPATVNKTPFNNHLKSTVIVSPAQLYQVTKARTDFQLGYDSAESSDKATGSETTNTNIGPGLFAAGIYNTPFNARVGLSVDYTTMDLKSTNKTTGQPDAEAKATGTDMVFRPQVAYPIMNMVVVGASYDIYQNTVKPEEGETQTASYGRFHPGALFMMRDLEAGITYQQAVNTRDTEDAKVLPVAEPAEVTLHGRYAINDSVKAGGIVQTIHHSGLDKDTTKDQNVFSITGEMAPNHAISLEGALQYGQSYYKNKDTMNSDNIGYMGLEAALDYEVTSAATVGGAVGYATGSESNAGVDYTKNDLTMALRGQMAF